MRNSFAFTHPAHSYPWAWLVVLGSMLFSMLPGSLPLTQIALAQTVACGGNFPASADVGTDISMPDTNRCAVSAERLGCF